VAGCRDRPRGSDGGRVEPAVTTTADTVNVAPGDGVCADGSGDSSLRAAVQEANATPGAAEIRLAAGTYNLSLTGAGEDAAATGDLDILDALHIDGRNAVIDLAGLGDRAFDVFAVASISNVIIVNGAPPEGESGG
jgi:hypothetical protein